MENLVFVESLLLCFAQPQWWLVGKSLENDDVLGGWFYMWCWQVIASLFMAVEALEELATKLPEPRWSRETIFMAAYFFPEGHTMVVKKYEAQSETHMNSTVWFYFVPAEDGLHGLFKAVLCCR